MVSGVLIITCITNFVKGKIDLEEGEIKSQRGRNPDVSSLSYLNSGMGTRREKRTPPVSGEGSMLILTSSSSKLNRWAST